MIAKAHHAPLVVPSDYAEPVAPWEIADAVTAWARNNGNRTARFRWSKELGCWIICLSLKDDDPQMKAYREGRLKHAPTESVILHEWSSVKGRYIACNIEQYGAAGIVALLDKGNTWSGRGEFGSLSQAVEAAASRARDERNKIRKKQREMARDMAADTRRQILKIPYLPVGLDIKEIGNGSVNTEATGT